MQCYSFNSAEDRQLIGTYTGAPTVEVVQVVKDVQLGVFFQFQIPSNILFLISIDQNLKICYAKIEQLFTRVKHVPI